MNSNNLEKLNVYRLSSIWLRIYQFAYLIGFFIVYLAIMLNQLTDPNTWQAVFAPLAGEPVTFESVFAIFAVLLIVSTVVNAALLPMLNRAAFAVTMIHLALQTLQYPLIWFVSTILPCSIPHSFLQLMAVLTPIAAVFSVLNCFYFCKRYDLFCHDIVRLVTDQEKTEIKSIYR